MSRLYLFLLCWVVSGPNLRAAVRLTPMLPSPGGTVAFGRAIGLDTPVDRSRFVAEVARLTYGSPRAAEGVASSMLMRLRASLTVAERFESALAALPNRTLTLARADEDKDAREQLKTVLGLVGLTLRERRGAYTVEADNDRAAAERVRLLGDLGVDLERLPARLNAGEPVILTLPVETVPIPLSAAVWSELLRRPVTAGDLFSAIFAEPRMALLCHGLAALDDETLDYVTSTPRLLERLSTAEVAPVFAAFASNIRVHGGRIVPPGGDPASALWEAVVGEKTTEADVFLRALVTRNDGRLAYLYDLIGEVDPGRAAFALGLGPETTGRPK